MKVRVNGNYVFNAVGMDIYAPAHQGLANGDRVKVINKHGCPPANTMGCCYVERAGKFMGMVLCNSLEPAPKTA
jgi:hypothetical protein